MERRLLWIVPLLIALAVSSLAAAQQMAPTQNPNQAQDSRVQPNIEQWQDDFGGDGLDGAKWEPYTFDGGGGKIEVKDNQLRMRGSGSSRSGVRSKPSFQSDRFYVEATLAKVGPRHAQPGEQAFPPGFAIVAILFDGNPANRIEWILRSDGFFEAWVSVDGRMERVDNNKLATKERNVRMGVGRRGDHIFFMLNGEVGLEHLVRGLAQNFKVMLYGFGSTENNWDSVAVQTLKQ